MEKERCHGCDKWFTQIEQQRLVVECHNRNNGMDPLIGTIVVASTPEVDDGMSTGMCTRGAKRQRCIKQEDDNQSNVTFEGIGIVDDFGPMIPSPEADLHSRGSISAVHELEVAAYGNHCLPPPAAERCLRMLVPHKHPTRQCH
jgi:hypothetical protein